MNCIKMTRSDRKGYTIVTVDEIADRIKEEFDNPFWVEKGVKLTLEVVEMTSLSEDGEYVAWSNEQVDN